MDINTNKSVESSLGAKFQNDNFKVDSCACKKMFGFENNKIKTTLRKTRKMNIINHVL